MKDNLLTLQKEIEELNGKRIGIELEKASMQHDIPLLKYEKENNDISVRLSISELENEVRENESRYRYLIKASESGVITTIHGMSGMQVKQTLPLLSLIPENSKLEIELLLPTRSSGFIKLGNIVKLRFDAFPYQKFGFINATIIRIDKSLILPGEDNIPIQFSESVYRIRATLSKQEIDAYGQHFQLKIGMLADADIILEKRSLLDWMFEPIYSLKGKLY